LHLRCAEPFERLEQTPEISSASEESEDEPQMHFIVKKTFLECVPDHRDDVMSKTKSEPIKFKDGRTALNDISVGSRLHSAGYCKPCAWFWKPKGCLNGAECRHCHLCPKGEITRRKREARRNSRQQRHLIVPAIATPENAGEAVEHLSEGPNFGSRTPSSTPSPTCSLRDVSEGPSPGGEGVTPRVFFLLVPVAVPTFAFQGEGPVTP